MQALAIAKVAAKEDEGESDKQQKTEHKRKSNDWTSKCTFGSFCNL
jgi:hypothetical protein